MVSFLVSLMVFGVVGQVEFTAATPVRAVELAASYMTGGGGAVEGLSGDAFTGFPQPAPGISFIARPSTRDSSARTLPMELRAVQRGRTLARRIFVFPRTEAQPVVVAVRTIDTGQMLRASDLELRSVTALGSRIQYADAVDQVIGKIAATRLMPQRPIALRMVRAAFAVKRGQLVAVDLRRGPLRLTMKGKAMANGPEGAMIRVMNPVSGRIVQARVTGPGAAVVDHAGGRQ